MYLCTCVLCNMSQIFILKSNSHLLSVDFQDSIRLDPNSDYGLALTGFFSYNSIPNIEPPKNKFYYTKPNEPTREITIPIGTYEISHIEKYLKNRIYQNSIVKDNSFFIKANNNTLKCEILCKDFQIDFTPQDSIATILGFSSQILKQDDQVHSSDLPVDIVKVRTIQITCNITTGAYFNENQNHLIYHFSLNSNPGYSINETPLHLTYLPLINKRSITNITLNILDQNFRPVNFRGEEQTVRLELKKLN